MRVKVVQRKGASRLVEWVDELGYLRRSIVPHHVLSGEEADVAQCDAPEEGIEYGMAWEELIGPLAVTPAEVAHELRKVGIWTYDDLRQDPQGAINAFATVYGMDAQRLREAARLRVTQEN